MSHLISIGIIFQHRALSVGRVRPVYIKTSPLYGLYFRDQDWGKRLFLTSGLGPPLNQKLIYTNEWNFPRGNVIFTGTTKLCHSFQ